ncbi:MAG: hypothetical protein H7Z72_26825 [Bacteroidetes bacterium]|nr:hypothetical protein [Fibrella sp.]
MTFHLSSTSSQGSFDLLDERQTLLTHFQYENWFSSTGSAVFKETNITIKPRNFWQSAFDVLINDTDKGDIAFNWQGHILIRLERAGLTTNYRLKAKGFWKFTFVLENEQQQPVLHLEPTFQWTKMGYSYTAELDQTGSTSVADADLILLLLTCGYGANLYMTMMASVSA